MKSNLKACVFNLATAHQNKLRLRDSTQRINRLVFECFDKTYSQNAPGPFLKKMI